jgi:hypothetical protein
VYSKYHFDSNVTCHFDNICSNLAYSHCLIPSTTVATTLDATTTTLDVTTTSQATISSTTWGDVTTAHTPTTSATYSTTSTSTTNTTTSTGADDQGATESTDNGPKWLLAVQVLALLGMAFCATVCVVAIVVKKKCESKKEVEYVLLSEDNSRNTQYL